MKVHLEKVNLSVTTKKNTLPTSKPIAGNFRVSPDWENAAFVEEEGASVIYGEPKSRRVMRRERSSVWWNPEKVQFTVRVQVNPNRSSVIKAEWEFEECINFIKTKITEGNYGK